MDELLGMLVMEGNDGTFVICDAFCIWLQNVRWGVFILRFQGVFAGLISFFFLFLLCFILSFFFFLFPCLDLMGIGIETIIRGSVLGSV